MLAVFSVPESERGKRHVLRSRLDQLGFGSAASGVWIAPQQLAEEARHRIGTLGLTDYVELFEGARMPLAQLRATVGQWWDLAGLAEGYDGFCASHEPVMRRWSRQRRPGDAAAFADYMRVVDSWRKIVYRDPGCPPSCCPPTGSATGPNGSSSGCTRRCAARPRSTSSRCWRACDPLARAQLAQMFWLAVREEMLGDGVGAIDWVDSEVAAVITAQDQGQPVTGAGHLLHDRPGTLASQQLGLRPARPGGT